MSSLDECGGQFTIIVNLAVEDYPDRAILVGEGLVAGIEVDDAEASHPDTQRCGRVDATSVRAPSCQRLAHLAQHFAICGGRIRTAKDAENTAHLREPRSVASEERATAVFTHLSAYCACGLRAPHRCDDTRTSSTNARC